MVTFVAPQMYNNPVPYQTFERFMTALQKRRELRWNGLHLRINIPSHKLAFGFPATQGAGRGNVPWSANMTQLVKHYRSSPALMSTGGMMTWSIGWDASAGWPWIT